MKFLVTVLTLFACVCTALSSSGLLKAQQRSGTPFIKLTRTNYERVLSGPRDANLVVLLTASNTEIGCSICQQIQPEFEQLAASWVAEHPEGDGLFFARADFAEGHKEVFQAFQLTNVPRLYLYRATQDDSPFNAGYDVLNIPQNEPFAANMAQFLAESLDMHVVLRYPIQWGSIAFTGGAIVLALLLAVSQKTLVMAIVTSKQVWGVLGVFLILLFNTGYMFNAIRGMPFVTEANGMVKYFISGQQQQLGVEVQIMSVVYGLLALSVVFLVTKTTSLTDSRVRLGVVIYLVGVNVVLYSMLMSIFQYKSSGYPFHLLNIWSPK